MHSVGNLRTVVDEVSMIIKFAFEALDRVLRDLTGNNQLMGGMCMLTLDKFCRLFRVVLKVIL